MVSKPSIFLPNMIPGSWQRLLPASHGIIADTAVMNSQSCLLMKLANNQVRCPSYHTGLFFANDLDITSHHVCHDQLIRPIQTTAPLSLFLKDNKEKKLVGVQPCQKRITADKDKRDHLLTRRTNGFYT